jgi:hypothetical protein
LGRLLGLTELGTELGSEYFEDVAVCILISETPVEIEYHQSRGRRGGGRRRERRGGRRRERRGGERRGGERRGHDEELVKEGALRNLLVGFGDVGGFGLLAEREKKGRRQKLAKAGQTWVGFPPQPPLPLPPP